MPSDPTYAGKGNLQGIADAAVARELRNLWSVIENGTGQVGEAKHRFVRLEELTKVKSDLLAKITPSETPAFRQDFSGDGSGGGGGWLDLRPLNNVWTGRNYWIRGETPGVVNYRFVGLTSGLITSYTTPGSILVENTDVQALVTIEKSSDASIFHSKLAGNAGLFVQHRTGGVAGGEYAGYAIRAHAESIVSAAPGVPNGVAAGLFAVHNATTSGIGWALKADAYHKATAGADGGATYGVEAQMFRMFLDGKTVGFHARTMAQGNYSQANDWAFLASPQSWNANAKFKVAFGAGSDWIGPLNCDIGLDLGYASSNSYAIVVQTNKRILLNGPASVASPVTMQYGLGMVQFVAGTNPTMLIEDTGRVHTWNGLALDNLNDPSAMRKAVLQWNDVPGVLQWRREDNEIFGIRDNGRPRLFGPTKGLNEVGAQIGYVEAEIAGQLRLVPFLDPGNGTWPPVAPPPGGGDTFTWGWPFCGGGVDGVCVLDGTNTFPWAIKTGNDYAMINNVAASSLTINAGCRIIQSTGQPGSFAIWVTGTLTNNGEINGDGRLAVLSAPGGAWAGGTVGGGGDGANGKGPGINGNGNNTIAYGGVSSGGAIGGNGGVGGGAAPNTGGTVGGVVPPGVTQGGIGAAYNIWYASVGRNIISSGVPISGGSGGSGGAAIGGVHSNSGAGGGGGRCIHIVAKFITGTGTITAKGGNGSNGNGGNTGGGGGGGGGMIQVVTQTADWQTLMSASVAGGIGGAGAGTGTAGANGGVGRIMEYIIGA